MPRKAGDQLFKRNDFRRLVDAANRSGLPIARITATKGGLTLVVGEPAKADGSDDNDGANAQESRAAYFKERP